MNTKNKNVVKRLINIGHIYTAKSRKWKPFIDVTPSEGFVWWEGRGNDVRERFNEIYDSIYDGRKFNPFIYDESGINWQRRMSIDDKDCKWEGTAYDGNGNILNSNN